MLNKKITQITALLLSACIAAPVIAQDNSRFINRKAEGWFWYAPEPTEQEVEPEIIPEPIPIAEAPPPEPLKEPPAAQAKAPDMFSAAWIRENINKYLDAAIDNPTVENVEAFLYLQRLSMDKSEQFADAAEMAVTGNPMLDEMTRRPTSTFGTQKVDAVAGKRKESLLVDIAQRVGVFFFYNAKDEYSQSQAPLIKLLEQSGFAIIAISEDGAPIPGFENDFNYRTDSGHAKELGVTTLPAVFIASPEGQFAPVGQGMMSLPDLNNRIVISALRENWITQDEYNNTRPVTNTDNLAVLLDSNIKNQGQPEGDEDNDNFVSPEQLMKFIQDKTRATRSIYE